jgi:hypothetical protein
MDRRLQREKLLRQNREKRLGTKRERKREEKRVRERESRSKKAGRIIPQTHSTTNQQPDFQPLFG